MPVANNRENTVRHLFGKPTNGWVFWEKSPGRIGTLAEVELHNGDGPAIDRVFCAVVDALSVNGPGSMMTCTASAVFRLL